MSAETPLMKQYFSIKNQYKDEVLFFRLGDFYEMFFDDAIELQNFYNALRKGRCPYVWCALSCCKSLYARLLRLGRKLLF